MEVKIGIQQAAREMAVDVDSTQEFVQQQVADAVAAGTLLTLTDTKGRTIAVPGAKIAYVEIGSTQVGAVGFRS
ncbi:DUF3107 domain-containing protein [Nocardioides bruguierae]|uniref:DUF3107 domain-containing protein n=1 Tax=Nocardioides bruguierae TaxID=2945102 RepID=A0A9X2D4U3_9ACTN|nr:DUF3107 domain-containing protein [Nocardioides bruguierae]MCL8024930.1 DUF3107 domain-containing protein [Nocardioides bruguierae]MCM0619333.1 DUF3107 domain-containing protein [Nocardioides bruguierae]